MKTKQIHRKHDVITIDKTKHIYQLNMETGKVTRAETIEIGKKNYQLIEFDRHIYLPADSLELAQQAFDVVFRHAKHGNIKLSFKEWVAKWLTVFTIKYKRLIGKRT